MHFEVVALFWSKFPLFEVVVFSDKKWGFDCGQKSQK